MQVELSLLLNALASNIATRPSLFYLHHGGRSITRKSGKRI